MLIVKAGQAFLPQFHLWIDYLKVESVTSCRFPIYDYIPECIHPQGCYNISAGSVFLDFIHSD